MLGSPAVSANLKSTLSRHRRFKRTRIDNLPRRVIAKHSSNQSCVNPVTRALSLDMTQNRHAQQCQIANDVDYFMPNKLVSTPEAFFIEDTTSRRQHDRVIEGTAARKPHVSKRFDLVKKPKRSSRSQLSRKLPVGYFDVIPLGPDHRMRKLNQTRNRESHRRTDAHPSITFIDFNAFQHPEELTRCFKRCDSRMLNHIYKGLCASVYNWYLKRVDVYDAIIDVAPGKCCQ